MTTSRYDYARRVRKVGGRDTYARVPAYARVHAGAGGRAGLRLVCGPVVDEGWWYEPCLFEGDWDPARVTCPRCRRELRRREGRR